MTKPLFRLTSVEFDSGEEVCRVTADAAGACLEFIRAEVPGARIEAGEIPSVTLSASEVRHLRDAAGKVRGTDPRYEGSYPMYDSLCRVVYRLMDDD